MTDAAQRARPGPYSLGLVLPLLLVAALLVPVAVLFGQNRQAIEDARTFAGRERHGVEYLRALGQVTIALVDAQSAAVAGRPASWEAMTRALRDTGAVDARLGAELRTRERWTGLRAKIETLPAADPAGAERSYLAYGEASDLLLDLYGKVRESSGLVRDPQEDLFHLQDAVAEDLPEALIRAGRLADLAGIAPSRRPADQIRTIGELTLARSATQSSASDLVNDLVAAVGSTQSSNLGAKLLSHLDAYQRATETLAAGAALAGTPAGRPPPAGSTAGGAKPAGNQATAGNQPAGATVAVVDAARVAAARSSAQSAATELSVIISAELDLLLDARIDDLANRRGFAFGAAALALLLVSALATVLIVSARRRTPRQHPPADGHPPRTEHTRPPGRDAAAGPGRWDALAEPAGPASPGLNAGPPQPATTIRSNEPAQWGRPDAAR
jgi:hypothetical protein